MFFSNQARKVFILYRGDDLRKSMSDYLVRQIEVRDEIEVLLDTNVISVEGEDHLERRPARRRPSLHTPCSSLSGRRRRQGGSTVSLSATSVALFSRGRI